MFCEYLLPILSISYDLNKMMPDELTHFFQKRELGFDKDGSLLSILQTRINS